MMPILRDMEAFKPQIYDGQYSFTNDGQIIITEGIGMQIIQISKRKSEMAYPSKYG